MKRPLYHVTPAANRDSILADGIEPRSGAWLGTTWTRRVFLCTGKLSAHEIAHNFLHERHHGRDALILVLVDRIKIPGPLHDDDDYDRGVWTDQLIPPSAIIEIVDVDEDYFESRQFRRYMGS
jgi:hypothetical protein